MRGQILTARLDEVEYINFIGVVRYSDCTGLESYIEQLFQSQDRVTEIAINLENAEMLDSTALGLLARISIYFKKLTNKQPVIFVKKGELAHILRRVCFDQVFHIITNQQKKSSLPTDCDLNFVELATVKIDESAVLDSVVLAHKSLAEISVDNEHYYTDISKALIK
ncbi:MAG: anti-anti-sigma regulatory factor [Polaribacter sp.]|jgi:anti-anti-sigma regulatory factor